MTKSKICKKVVILGMILTMSIALWNCGKSEEAKEGATTTDIKLFKLMDGQNFKQ